LPRIESVRAHADRRERTSPIFVSRDVNHGTGTNEKIGRLIRGSQRIQTISGNVAQLTIIGFYNRLSIGDRLLRAEFPRITQLLL
jgi:hypothetical protein